MLLDSHLLDITHRKSLIDRQYHSRLFIDAFVGAYVLLLFVDTAYADDAKPTLLTRAKETVVATWESQSYELYIPINTWHNRAYYTKEEANSFNERPWGIGLGKYRYDEEGDWHGIYAMAFSDSNQELEPIVGYGFQKIWQASEQLKLGLGFTLGFTMREDSNYIPIPVLVPLFSVKYKEVALQSTYVPGGEGHGNILFTWLRWEI